LHGAGGRGNDNGKQLKSWIQQLALDSNRRDFPCYVIAPQSNSHWEIERFDAVKKIIETLPAVDMKRIYIMGHSMGGHGTFLWTQHDPDYFAAAAPCAGTGRTGRPEFVQP
jgi:predicted peptidase